MWHRRTVFYAGHVQLLIGAVLSLAIALTGCEEKSPKAASSSANPPPASTAAAAEARGSIEGHHLQVVGLDDIKTLIEETAERDQVLVIDFWATWCVPCVEMFPSLHEGLVARGEAVRAVTVTLDDPSREAKAVAFLAEHDALKDAYIIQNDSAAQQALADGLGENWDSLAVPAILVYDASGQLSDEFLEGGSTQAILEYIDRLLASGQEQNQ